VFLLAVPMVLELVLESTFAEPFDQSGAAAVDPSGKDVR
jgi:hypothetical protein